jgi:hypothetical protein
MLEWVTPNREGSEVFFTALYTAKTKELDALGYISTTIKIPDCEGEITLSKVATKYYYYGEGSPRYFILLADDCSVTFNQDFTLSVSRDLENYTYIKNDFIANVEYDLSSFDFFRRMKVVMTERNIFTLVCIK